MTENAKIQGGCVVTNRLLCGEVSKSLSAKLSEIYISDPSIPVRLAAQLAACSLMSAYRVHRAMVASGIISGSPRRAKRAKCKNVKITDERKRGYGTYNDYKTLIELGRVLDFVFDRISTMSVDARHKVGARTLLENAVNRSRKLAEKIGG